MTSVDLRTPLSPPIQRESNVTTPAIIKPKNVQQMKKPRRIPKPGLLTSSREAAAAAAAAAHLAMAAVSTQPSTLNDLCTLPMRCNLPRGPSEILPGLLYLGGIGEAMNKKVLSKLGIRLIINLARELDNFHTKYFTYIKVPLEDSESEEGMTCDLLHSLIEQIHSSIKRNEPVFVHCAGGISRSVTVVMAYFIRYGSHHNNTVELPSIPSSDDSSSPASIAAIITPPSYQSVYNFVQSRRLLACPNEGFVRILRTFREETIQGTEPTTHVELNISYPTISVQQTVTSSGSSSSPHTNLNSKGIKPLPGKSNRQSGATTATSASPSPSITETNTPAAQFTRLCEQQARDIMEGREIQIAPDNSMDANSFTTTTTTAIAPVPSTASQPLISIIMPVHNAATFLPATLTSILHQSYRPLELCLYDDASTDDSLLVIQQFSQEFAKCGIEIHIGSAKRSGLTQAKGAGFARNRAMEMAKGEFYAFQDSDDLSMPTRIERQWNEWKTQAAASAPASAVSLAATSNDVVNSISPTTPLPLILVGCHLERLPADATPRWTKWINSMTRQQLWLHAFREITIPCPTWFTHSSTFHRIGPFPELLGEDMHFFYSNLLSSGGQLTKVEGEPLLIYRNHSSNLSGRTPFEYLFGIRVAAMEKLILMDPIRFPSFSGTFTIWNAGKSGKRFYRLLSPEVQLRVLAFCDIDPKKIQRGIFESYREGERHPVRKIPIISWLDAMAPVIICVRQELEDDESQKEFRHRIEIIKGWKEGVDYFYLS